MNEADKYVITTASGKNVFGRNLMDKKYIDKL